MEKKVLPEYSEYYGFLLKYRDELRNVLSNEREKRQSLLDSNMERLEAVLALQQAETMKLHAITVLVVVMNHNKDIIDRKEVITITTTIIIIITILNLLETIQPEQQMQKKSQETTLFTELFLSELFHCSG